jgi:hypothetical protein
MPTPTDRRTGLRIDTDFLIAGGGAAGLPPAA